MSQSSHPDLHTQVTDLIIRAIEQGGTTVTMPWQRSGLPSMLPHNAHSKASYNGINIVALWSAAMLRGFPYAVWATYRQWVRRVSRMKGVTNESMSSVQLCRRVPRAVPATAPCEAGTKAQGGQPAIGEIRARRRSDG